MHLEVSSELKYKCMEIIPPLNQMMTWGFTYNNVNAGFGFICMYFHNLFLI